MSASPASPTPTSAGSLAGTQAPSQIEFLWERYRSLIWLVMLAIAAALGINYGLKYFNQRAIDEKWSGFAAAVNLDNQYVAAPGFGIPSGLAEDLQAKDLAALEAALPKSEEAQKPFVLLAIARRAAM